ncbi:MAG TPA: ABC transporter permease [Ktedonobacterales bacterium]|nr:ABC transporter permease [Ktedonobacterales bacterium]
MATFKKAVEGALPAFPPAIGRTARWLKHFGVQNSILLAVLALVTIPALTNPSFTTEANLVGLLQASAVLTTVTMGEAMVMLVAGIDLAVGAAVALGSTILALTIAAGHPLLVGVVASVVVVGLCGFVSGLVVAKLKLPSFIVTFGMLGVEEGIALVISGGNRISLPFSSNLPSLMYSGVGDIPYAFCLSLVLLAAGSFFLRYIRTGRRMYATGSNLDAARVSGVRIDRVIITAFVLSSVFAALGGVIYTSRIISGDPVGDLTLNLQAIAAGVIGGVSLFGGRGTLRGAFLGAIAYTLIINVLNLYGVNPNVAELVSGVIIIGAAYAS